MSGLPGRFLACNRNLTPNRCSALRSARSGAVFVPRMRDIRSERASGLKVSVMRRACYWYAQLQRAASRHELLLCRDRDLCSVVPCGESGQALPRLGQR